MIGYYQMQEDAINRLADEMEPGPDIARMISVVIRARRQLEFVACADLFESRSINHPAGFRQPVLL